MIGEYNAGELKPNQIRISPSGVGNLIKNRPYWIKANILKHKYISKTQDNMHLGTAFHHLAEQYLLDGDDIQSMQEAFEWLESKNYADMWGVGEKLQKMYDAWVDEVESIITPNPKIEKWVQHEISDQLIISGTVDAIFDDTIIDWKTSGSRKSNLDSYRQQLYMYAWLARKNGATINNVGAVVVKVPAKRKKPTSDGEAYGASAIDILIEPIDESYMSELIVKLKEAVEDVQDVVEKPIIMDWIRSTDIPDPYDRGF